jgi:hypothetical protein
MLPQPALLAQETPEDLAKQHNSQGLQNIDAGNFVGAVEEFKKAYELDPKPKYIFNTARAYDIMGRGRSALQYYERFLTLKPSEEARKKTEDLMAMVRLKLGTLVVKAVPDGAGLEVDGTADLCRIGEACLLDVGDHAVKVSKPGYEAATRSVRLEAGESRSEDFILISVLAEVNVEANVAGAQASLNGQDIGPCPTRKEGLIPGDYLVRVTMAGYVPQEKTVSVKKGEKLGLSFTLEKVKAKHPTRRAVVGRSWAFPGMGQLHADKKGAAAAFLALELTSLSGVAAGVIAYYVFAGKRSEAYDQSKYNDYVGTTTGPRP